VWDTAGQERFRAITISFLRGAQGIALVFDMTKRASFEHVRDWMRQVRDMGEVDIPTIVLANKVRRGGTGGGRGGLIASARLHVVCRHPYACVPRCAAQCDLEDRWDVKREEVTEAATEWGVPVFFTSAKDASQVRAQSAQSAVEAS